MYRLTKLTNKFPYDRAQPRCSPPLVDIFHVLRQWLLIVECACPCLDLRLEIAGTCQVEVLALLQD